MKKTYIKPVTTAVKIETSHTLLVESQRGFGDPIDSASGADAREVINTPDAWEEW